MSREVDDDFPLIAPRRSTFGRPRADAKGRRSPEVDQALAVGAGISVALLIGVVGHLWLSGFGFGSDLLALRHVAAGAGGCGVARSVGLATAQQGYAGYWSALDRNGNGIACESYDPAAA